MKLDENFDFIHAGLMHGKSCWSMLLRTLLKVTVVLWGTCRSVSNFTVYIYRDVSACDGLNNQGSACHMSREVDVADNQKSPSETRMKRLHARQRRNIRTDLALTTVTDNNAALLHMLSMTNRFVHRLCRGRFSLTWDKSLILSRIPPCFLTALKWQKRAWIHSVACGAPAGLLHGVRRHRCLRSSKHEKS